MRRRYYRNSIITSLNAVQQELDRPTNSIFVLVLIIFIALIMVGIVWQKVKVSQLSLEIDQLEKQVTYYKELNEKLQGKVLFLMNEDRVVNIARDNLKMIFPPYEMVPLTEKIEND